MKIADLIKREIEIIEQYQQASLGDIKAVFAKDYPPSVMVQNRYGTLFSFDLINQRLIFAPGQKAFKQMSLDKNDTANLIKALALAEKILAQRVNNKGRSQFSLPSRENFVNK